MAIPDYQTIMLPILELAEDGKEWPVRELAVAVSDRFELSEDERTHLLPSGTTTVIRNRVHWAKHYLVRAGLLDAPRRGAIQITVRGREVLKTKPSTIDVAFLRQFPEFLEFHSFGKDGKESSAPKTETPLEAVQTPSERMEQANLELRNELESEVLSLLTKCTASFFEQVVVDLLVAMGYGGSHADAGKALGRSGDGGVDGVIGEDRLGLEVVYVQAKRWQSSVGRPVVQAFAGALQGFRARKGVMMTTSSFTADAKEYVRYLDSRIVLIDGAAMARLLVEFGVGVSVRSRFEVKGVDSDYFSEGLATDVAELV